MNLINKISIFILVVTSTLTLVSVENAYSRKKRLKEGDKFPTVRLKSISKIPLDRKRLRGSVVVYDFSASWTHGSSDALKFYNTLLKKYKNRKLQIVAINTDQELKDAKRHIRKANPIYPVVYDNDHKFVKQIDPIGFPIVYIVNRKGRVIEVIRDYCENEFDVLERKILKAFKK